MNKLLALSTLVLAACSTALLACGGTSVPVAEDGQVTVPPLIVATAGAAGAAGLNVNPGGPLQPAAGGDGGSSDVSVPPSEPAGGFGGDIDPGGPLQPAAGGDAGSSDVSVPPFEPAGGTGGEGVDPGGPIQHAAGGVGGALPGDRVP